MVFRGKPSKSCERCRNRRLKCSLQRPTCSSCLRAGVICSGWRNVTELRVHDQSHAVARSAGQHCTPPIPQSFHVPIATRARDSFYFYYVSNPLTRCWKFLQPYHEIQSKSSPHLSIAIDALSLAYLWHEVDSEAALLAARRSYGLALGKTRAALGYSVQQIDRSTVLAALVLDIVEKVLSTSGRPLSAHVDGALGLVKLIGIGRFKDSTSLQVLISLTNQSMIGSLALQQPIHPDVVSLRSWLEAGLLAGQYPTGVTELFVRYAVLQSRFSTNCTANDAYVLECYSMDSEIAGLELNMPPLWQYQTIELDAASQGRFGQYCHVYPHRNICQARNLIRVCRLLLNEAVLEYASPSAVDGASAGLTDIARDNAIRLAGEIYTSVAQFADCRTHAKHSQSHVPNKVPDVTNCRSHSPTHTGDCYTLIFPLYAAGRTHISKHMKHQILNYLYYIADHFRIRNAKNIAQSLEREQGRQPGVWDVYAKLGSYAFHM